MKLERASKLVSEGIEETPVYYKYPRGHWRTIRTNNPIAWIMREERYRARVVGSFPDGESALMLVSAGLRHIAGIKWGRRRYLNMELLKELEKEQKES